MPRSRWPLLSFLVTALFQGEVILGKVDMFIQVRVFIYVYTLYIHAYIQAYICSAYACLWMDVCLGTYGNVVHW